MNWTSPSPKPVWIASLKAMVEMISVSRRAVILILAILRAVIILATLKVGIQILAIVKAFVIPNIVGKMIVIPKTYSVSSVKILIIVDLTLAILKVVYQLVLNANPAILIPMTANLVVMVKCASMMVLSLQDIK